jgi:ribosomal protein L17
MALIPSPNLQMFDSSAANQLMAQQMSQGFQALAGGLTRRFENQRQEDLLEEKNEREDNRAADAKNLAIFQTLAKNKQMPMKDLVGSFFPELKDKFDFDKIEKNREAFVKKTEEFKKAMVGGESRQQLVARLSSIQQEFGTIAEDFVTLSTKGLPPNVDPAANATKSFNTYLRLVHHMSVKEFKQMGERAKKGKATKKEIELLNNAEADFERWSASIPGAKAEQTEKGKFKAAPHKIVTTDDTAKLIDARTLKQALHFAGKEWKDVYEAIQKGEVFRLGEKNQQDIANLAGGIEAVKQIEETALKIFKAKGGIEAFFAQNAKLTVDQLIQKNPEVKAYFDRIEGLTTPIAKGIFSEVGNLAKEDNLRILKLLPRKTDSARVAALKIKYLKDFIDARKAALLAPVLGMNLGKIRETLDEKLKMPGIKIAKPEGFDQRWKTTDLGAQDMDFLVMSKPDIMPGVMATMKQRNPGQYQNAMSEFKEKYPNSFKIMLEMMKKK